MPTCSPARAVYTAGFNSACSLRTQSREVVGPYFAQAGASIAVSGGEAEMIVYRHGEMEAARGKHGEIEAGR